MTDQNICVTVYVHVHTLNSLPTIMRSTFPRSGVLSLGLSSVHAVLPSTLISQVESLLDSHRIEDAVNLADAQRVKLQGNVSVDPDEACLLIIPLNLPLISRYPRQTNCVTFTNG